MTVPGAPFRDAYINGRGPIHCVKTFGYTCPKIIRIGKGPDADEYTLKTMCKKKNVPEIYCRKARFSFGKRKA